MSVFGIQYFLLVPPNTEVENKVMPIGGGWGVVSNVGPDA